MADYDVIRAAIEAKTNISATYQGHHRELSPHAIGTKNGREQALFLQFGGTSSSGLSDNPEENWRCIPIADMVDVQAFEGEWETAANHSQAQTCVGDVDIEATY